MTNFVNLTPHPISLANKDGEVFCDIPPSGDVARVKVTVEKTFSVVTLPIPVVKNTYGDIENLPLRETCKSPSMELAEKAPIYIVSALVLNALRLNSDRKDVIAPDTGPSCVRDSDGRIIAVTQFIT